MSLFNFVDQKEYPTWKEYLKKMERDGTWGDHLILQAAARHLNCVIHIISSHPEFDVKIEPDSNSTTCDVAELLLGHIYEYHYVSLEAGTASLIFIELFGKKYLLCQWFERMYLCGFVALWLCMFGCLLQGPIRLKVL